VNEIANILKWQQVALTVPLIDSLTLHCATSTPVLHKHLQGKVGYSVHLITSHLHLVKPISNLTKLNSML